MYTDCLSLNPGSSLPGGSRRLNPLESLAQARAESTNQPATREGRRLARDNRYVSERNAKPLANHREQNQRGEWETLAEAAAAPSPSSVQYLSAQTLVRTPLLYSPRRPWRGNGAPTFGRRTPPKLVQKKKARRKLGARLFPCPGRARAGLSLSLSLVRFFHTHPPLTAPQIPPSLIFFKGRKEKIFTFQAPWAFFFLPPSASRIPSGMWKGTEGLKNRGGGKASLLSLSKSRTGQIPQRCGDNSGRLRLRKPRESRQQPFVPRGAARDVPLGSFALSSSECSQPSSPCPSVPPTPRILPTPLPWEKHPGRSVKRSRAARKAGWVGEGGGRDEREKQQKRRRQRMLLNPHPCGNRFDRKQRQHAVCYAYPRVPAEPPLFEAL